MPVNILDVLASDPTLGWLVARVKTIDAVNKKLVLVIGAVADPAAVVIEGASYLSSYSPIVGDIVHALIRDNIGVLVIGTTTAATGPSLDSLYVNVAGDTMTGALNLVGNSTAATQAVGDNDTSIATTAFVNAEIANDAPTKVGGGASGTWPINITGNAHSVDNFHFAWRDDGAQRAYILNADSPSDVHLFPAASLTVSNSDRWDGAHMVWSGQGVLSYYLMSNDGVWFYPVLNSHHGHRSHSSGYYVVGFDAGSLAAGTAYGPWTIGHGLGQTPWTCQAGGIKDDGVHSIVTSIGNLWDATNVLVTARNMAASAEACNVHVVSFLPP